MNAAIANKRPPCAANTRTAIEYVTSSSAIVRATTNASREKMSDRDPRPTFKLGAPRPPGGELVADGMRSKLNHHLPWRQSGSSTRATDGCES